MPGAAIRARATAVAMYAEATFAGSSVIVVRSIATGSGRRKAARTAATASAGARPPTRTPATRTPLGRVARSAGTLEVVVGAAVVVVTSVVETAVETAVDVVTSAITAPEKAPAATKPSTKRTTACRRFTAQGV